MALGYTSKALTGAAGAFARVGRSFSGGTRPAAYAPGGSAARPAASSFGGYQQPALPAGAGNALSGAAAGASGQQAGIDERTAAGGQQNRGQPAAPISFDYSQDPILASVRTMAAQGRAAAQASALRQQKGLAIHYGDERLGNTIDRDTGQAAAGNPFSLLARLAHERDLTTGNLQHDRQLDGTRRERSLQDVMRSLDIASGDLDYDHQLGSRRLERDRQDSERGFERTLGDLAHQLGLSEAGIRNQAAKQNLLWGTATQNELGETRRGFGRAREDTEHQRQLARLLFGEEAERGQRAYEQGRGEIGYQRDQTRTVFDEESAEARRAFEQALAETTRGYQMGVYDLGRDVGSQWEQILAGLAGARTAADEQELSAEQEAAMRAIQRALYGAGVG